MSNKKKNNKKPPVPSLEQEAKNFIDSKLTTKTLEINEGIVVSSHHQMLAASILSGLMVKGGGIIRAEELVEEAFRYADLILKYKK